MGKTDMIRPVIGIGEGSVGLWSRWMVELERGCRFDGFIGRVECVGSGVKEID